MPVGARCGGVARRAERTRARRPGGQAGAGGDFATGLAPPARPLRIAVLDGVPGRFGVLDPEVAAAVHGAAAVLEGLGHRLEEDHPTLLDSRAPLAVVGKLVFATVHWAVRRWERICGVPCRDDQLEPITRYYLAQGRELSGADVFDLEEASQLQTREVARWFESGPDLILSATCATTPPPHGELQAETDDDVPRALQASLPTLALTAWCNVTGLPAISVPVGMSTDGLPIGVQLIAAHGREALLLSVARQLEEAAPWAHRHPTR